MEKITNSTIVRRDGFATMDPSIEWTDGSPFQRDLSESYV